MLLGDGREPVKVYLRLKPMGETRENDHIEVKTEILKDNTVKLIPHTTCKCSNCIKARIFEAKTAFAVARSLKTEKTFRFDRIFEDTASQEDIFEIANRYIEAAVVGYTSTFLTYGPAGGGKTYTLLGTQDEPGVLPRACEKIFKMLQEIKNSEERNLAEVELSYVEFVDNMFVNLLRYEREALAVKDMTYTGRASSGRIDESDMSDNEDLNLASRNNEAQVIIHSENNILRESKELGVFLSGSRLRIPVRSARHCLKLIERADNNRARHFASPEDAKNRGHFIFTVYADTKVDNSCKFGKIHFIDLAGGEKVDEALSSDKTLQDVQFINKSLLSFGDVLFALSQQSMMLKRRSTMRLDLDLDAGLTSPGGKNAPPTPGGKAPSLAPSSNGHVPYLNSKITYFMKDAFGGNGRTTMILNIPPDSDSYHQTVRVYEYAARGRKVVNRPIPNVIELSKTLNLDLSSEVSILKQLKSRMYDPLPPQALERKRSTLSVSSPSPSNSKPRSYTMMISFMMVEHIPYLNFPLKPWVVIEVGNVTNKSSSQLYTRDAARYNNEELSFEVSFEDYESGLEMELHVYNQPPYADRVELGRTKVIIKDILPNSKLDEKLSVELPLYHAVGMATIKKEGMITIDANLKYTPIKLIDYAKLSSAAPRKMTFSPKKTSRSVDTGFDWSAGIAHLLIKRVASPDALVGSAQTADPSSSYKFCFESRFAETAQKTVFISGKPRYRGRDVVANVAFEDPNTQFDVSKDNLLFDELQVLMYVRGEGQGSGQGQVIGRAKIPLLTLFPKLEAGNEPEVLAMLKDVAGNNTGKVYINMALVPFGKIPKVLHTTPEVEFEGLDMLLPEDFNSGWIRIRSAEAIRLNTLKLIGNHARYSDIFLDDEKAEESVKQDLVLVVEYGDHWASRTPIKYDHEDHANWTETDFKVFVEKEDLKRIPFKFSIYNVRADATSNLIGSALVPITQLIPSSEMVFSNTSITLKNTKKKPNGKLFVSGLLVKDSSSSWMTAVVSKVHHGGKYDVVYEDGEVEYSISKDLLSLLVDEKKFGTARTAMKLKPRYDVGTKVEVQYNGKDLWYPAMIAVDHANGYYDVESEYEIPKNNINEAQIRLTELTPQERKRTARRMSGKFMAGDKVEGNLASKGLFYPAKIWKAHVLSDGSFVYDLDYKSGDRELGVTENKIRFLDSGNGNTLRRTGSDDDMSVRSGRSARSVTPRSKPASPEEKRGRAASRGRSKERSSPGTDRSRSRGASIGRTFSDDESTYGGTADLHQLGDRVEAKFRGSAAYYPGFICDVSLDGQEYGVLYDGGERIPSVPKDDIRRLPDDDDDAMDESKDAFEENDKVEANYRGLGKWMRGRIRKKRGGGVYDIDFDDGKLETKVDQANIRLMQTLIDEGFKYSVGDTVEVNAGGQGYWYRGTVSKRRIDGSYDIEYEDGDKEACLPGRVLRPATKLEDASIPREKPFFVIGDRVLVKSRSKAVEAANKEFNEAKASYQHELGDLFKHLRTIEEEEGAFKLAKKKSLDAFKLLQALKKDIANAEVTRNSSKKPLTAQGIALKEKLLSHDAACKLAQNLRKEEEIKVQDQLATLRNILAELSAKEKQRNAIAAKAVNDRSGLEEEELMALADALKKLRAEYQDLDAAKNKALGVIRSLANAKLNAAEEKRAVEGTNDIARELLDAYDAPAGYADNANGSSNEGKGADDALLYSISADDCDDVGYDNIYGISQSNDNDDDAGDNAHHAFDPEFEEGTKTGFGGLLLGDKLAKLDDFDCPLFANLSTPDSPKGPKSPRNFDVKKSKALARPGVISGTGPLNATDGLKHMTRGVLPKGGGLGSLQQSGFEAANVPDRGVKELSFDFGPQSFKRAASTANAGAGASPATGTANGGANGTAAGAGTTAGAGSKPNKASSDIMKSISEKKNRAATTEKEYYKLKDSVGNDKEKCLEAEKIMDDYINSKANLKPLLSNLMAKEFQTLRTKINALKGVTKAQDDKRQGSEDAAKVAKDNASEALKAAVNAVIASNGPNPSASEGSAIDSTNSSNPTAAAAAVLSTPFIAHSVKAIELLEKAKQASVEEWSSWEDSKLMAMSTQAAYADLLAAIQKAAKEVSGLEGKQNMLPDYLKLRQEWDEVLTSFDHLDQQVEEKNDELAAAKHDLAREIKALELISKRAALASAVVPDTPQSILQRSAPRTASFSPVGTGSNASSFIGKLNGSSAPTTPHDKAGLTLGLSTPTASALSGERKSPSFNLVDGNDAALLTREEERAHNAESEYEGLIMEALGEEKKWTPQESVAFGLSEHDSIPTPDYLSMDNLTDATALSAASKHLKKALDARKAALRTRESQLSLLDTAGMKILTEKANISASIAGTVFASDDLAKVLKDVEIEAANTISMKELSDAIFHLQELKEEVASTEVTVRNERAHLLDTLATIGGRTDSSANANAGPEEGTGSSVNLNQEIEASLQKALDTSSELAIQRLEIEDTLDQDAIQRISLQFRAITAGSEPGSYEIDHGKMAEVNDLYLHELAKLQQAAHFAEEQLAALRHAGKLSKLALDEVSSDYVKKQFALLTAAEAKWRATLIKREQAAAKAAEIDGSLESQQYEVDAEAERVQARVELIKNALSSLRKGQQFMESPQYIAYTAEMEETTRRTLELAELRQTDRTKRVEITTQRDKDLANLQHQKEEVLEALQLSRRSYEKFMHDKKPTFGDTVRDIRRSLAVVSEAIDAAEKVNEWTEQECKHLDYEKTLLENELEYLKYAAKSVEEIEQETQTQLERSQFRTALGEMLMLSGMEGAIKLNAQPIAAKDRGAEKRFVRSLHGKSGKLGPRPAVRHRIALQSMLMEATSSLDFTSVEEEDSGASDLKGLDYGERPLIDFDLIAKSRKVHPVPSSSTGSNGSSSAATAAFGSRSMSSSNISGSIAAAANMFITTPSYAPVMLPPRGNRMTNNKRKSVLMHEEQGFVRSATTLLGLTDVNSGDMLDLLPEIAKLERRAMDPQPIETEMQSDLAKLTANLQYYQKENNSFRSEAEFTRFLQEFYMEDEDLEFALKRIREAAVIKYLRKTTTVEETKQTLITTEVQEEEQISISSSNSSKAKIEIAVESY